MLFSKDNTKGLFTLGKLGSIKRSKYGVVASYDFGSDLFPFPLIVLLKSDFNCWSSFALSLVEKVTNGTQSFVQILADVPAPVELAIKQVDEYFN